MGRPLLKTEELRIKAECYFSPSEKADISAKARRAGLSLSSYIREVVIGHKVVDALPSINAQQWQSLSRTTANLNQIAKHLNEGKQVNIDPRVIEELVLQVQEVRLALMRGQRDT
jgi:uncharacterized coiled-coil protein SlyX